MFRTTGSQPQTPQAYLFLITLSFFSREISAKIYRISAACSSCNVLCSIGVINRVQAYITFYLGPV